jgi:transcriptional regulator NrdR family protein
MADMGPAEDRVIEPSKNVECPHSQTKVVSTWRAGEVISRRRECLLCGHRFDTDEKVRQPTIAANGNNPHCHVKKG